MGIQNLLRELKPITQDNVHLSKFSGQTCGVDASCWLHRASHSCAIDLVRGRATDKYLKFTLKCIDILKHFDITPIIVFDGAALPMKANENEKRRKIRQEAKIEAIRCWNNKKFEDAYKYASRAVRITNEMVSSFINQCRQQNVQFVCAPYEADAQLGYMYKNGQIDFVITEDSDLFLFGVRKSLVKFDANKCCGDFINLDQISTYKTKKSVKSKKKSMKNGDLCLFLKKFKTLQEFIHVCVLSGCDYVSSLYGIGIKKAVKYVTENRKIDRLLFTLMKQKDKKAPKDYKIQFKRAVLTFLHQTVYDMKLEKMIYLNPLTEDVELYLKDLNKHLSKLPEIQQYDSNDYRPTVYDKTLNFLGKHVDNDTAKLIAEGKVNARSLKKRSLCSSPIQNVLSEQNKNQKKKAHGFQIGAKRETCTKKKKEPKNGVRIEKYFGKLDNANIEIGDGLKANGDLDQLFTEFAFSPTEIAETNSTQSTECGHEQKEFSDDIAMKSEDEQDENAEHKPLKRIRKRKRSQIESCEIESTPFKERKNSRNRILRRKLNDGSAQMNHSNFVCMTPRNRLNNANESDLNGSLISDLYSHKKRRRSLNECENEQKVNQTNCIRNNPFSVNKIRTKQQVIDNDFYNIEDDDESDENNQKYSQSSQSQNEKQMEDIWKHSQLRKQREHEQKDEDEDEDEDMIILKNEKCVKPKIKTKRKKFNAPKFKNGPPPKKNSKKKRKVSKKKNVITKNKKRKGKQMTLNRMWAKAS